MLEQIKKKIQELNLVAVLDYSGRGGNAFFLTIFDQHPEVLCCPLMHYTYSYLLTEFGAQSKIPADVAKQFLKTKSYFRLLYNEPVGETKDLIYRLGLDPEVGMAVINRKILHELFEKFFLDKNIVTRKELALLPLLIYAAAAGRDISKIKYALLSDAISLRSENVKVSFSGQVIDVLLIDFPKAKLIDIVRDPRATFASPRHQFVNALGNMYALKPGCFFSRLVMLMSKNIRQDSGCVYLYWLMYIAQAYRTLNSKKQQYTNTFFTVKNEDLNLNFVQTLNGLVEWLKVEFLDKWHEEQYHPTILGHPWKGVGAYSNRYQPSTFGLLENDSDEVASKAIGPNKYVTERWKYRLNSREIELTERLFYDQLKDFKYESIYDKRNRTDIHCLIRTSLLPFQGEMPTCKWIINGRKVSWKTFMERLYYTITFFPFYIISRMVLFDLVLRKKFFQIDCKA